MHDKLWLLPMDRPERISAAQIAKHNNLILSDNVCVGLKSVLDAIIISLKTHHTYFFLNWLLDGD